jgi:hypothetical protein
MSKFDTNYRVVLRAELPAREAAFIATLGAEMAGPQGNMAGPQGAPLYQLTCTEVSFTNPAYLELKVFREPEEWLLPVYLPHDLVLIVSGRSDSLPTGFLR